MPRSDAVRHRSASTPTCGTQTDPLPQIRGLVEQFLEFAYPAACAVCEGPCEGREVCAACTDQMHELEWDAACGRCAMPVKQWDAPCPFCKGRGIYPYQKIVRLGRFVEPLKELVHHMKYHGRWGLGEQLADWLWEQQRVKDLLESADVIVPVPLHRLRQIERGYNQAEVLARRLGRRADRPVVRPAVRLRHTPSQTQQTSQVKRHENLRGAFGLRHGGRIAGKRVVVIDDVMTTGATLQALGRVLKAAEPASMSAIVIAVADPRGRGFQAV